MPLANVVYLKHFKDAAKSAAEIGAADQVPTEGNILSQPLRAPREGIASANPESKTEQGWHDRPEPGEWR